MTLQFANRVFAAMARMILRLFSAAANGDRWNRLAIALSLSALLIAGWVPGTVRAAETTHSYSVSSTVTDEDASYVAEGIALAQRYAESADADSPESLVINIRGTDDTTGGGAVAFYGGGYIVVFTGSPGWQASTPANRIRVVVHEFIHAVQDSSSHGGMGELPAWFIEGMAEFLSHDAVARLGLLENHESRDYQVWAVAASGNLPALAKLESAEAFYSEYGPAYSLAYLAIAELLEDRPPEALFAFVENAGAGGDWRHAFERAFGRNVADFYTEFAAARDVLISPVRIPSAFAFVRPNEQASRVLLARTPASPTAGDQLLVLAITEPGATCRFELRGDDALPEMTGTTFADAGGRLFWLVTIPDTLDRDRVNVAAECGADPLNIEIEVSNGD
jgi:hypothetical protein